MTTLAESRPDLVHPFQCQPGREGECSHFYLWFGGFVKCKAKENDPIHKNGPHLLTAENGEQAYCKDDPATCEHCAKGLPGTFYNWEAAEDAR
jgi:hypothetical protein